MQTLISILITLLIFTIIVVVHEGGHFFAARRNGVTVEEFAIGMGPRLFGWKDKKGTEVSVRLLPLGGYCRMEGEETTALEGLSGKDQGDGGSFADKSVWARIKIVAMGPIMNFVLAFVLLLCINAGFGFARNSVESVEAGSPAAEAGLMAGDKILAIDGDRIHVFTKISYILSEYQGDGAVTLRVRHADGTKEMLEMTPWFDEEAERFRVGFTASSYLDVKDMVAQRGLRGLWDLVCESFWYLWFEVEMTIKSVVGLITGALGLDALSGPIGVVSVVSDAYSEASAYGFWSIFGTMASLAVLLSANLGVLNLFPIPGLDGSRIIILIIEKIRKKPLDPKVENFIYLIGFVLLIGLMLVVALGDIRKLL